MRFNVFKRTKDEWCGTYRVAFGPSTTNGLVSIELSDLRSDGRKIDGWRVGAWGTDDFGMVKDFKTRLEASDCFLKLIQKESIEIDYLSEIGFEPL